MKKINRKNNIKGFTLVEIMVSVAIFTVVVTAGMGALTSMLHAYKTAQTEKKSADSLNYVLENMTREIRLGFNYSEGDGVDLESDSNSGHVDNGTTRTSNGPLIGFDSSNGRGYMIYHIKDGVLWRRHFSTRTDPVTIKREALTDITQVRIMEGRVTVMNTENDDMKQPLVWLQIIAAVPGDINSTRVIQTLISQRDLDTYN